MIPLINHDSRVRSQWAIIYPDHVILSFYQFYTWWLIPLASCLWLSSPHLFHWGVYKPTAPSCGMIHQLWLAKNYWLVVKLWLLTMGITIFMALQQWLLYIIIYTIMGICFWLVVDLPLWKIWKSNGIIVPNIWENNPNVPNNQPDYLTTPICSTVLE